MKGQKTIEKIKLTTPIIVEGKYDKIKLNQLIDGTIITTEGFRIFKDIQKRTMIRNLAQKNGIIIITDSDKAGFLIRRHLKSFLNECNIINLYIPQLIGKEKRKFSPSKENLLGVEGIDSNLLLDLFEKNGITSNKYCDNVKNITKETLYDDGFIGQNNSTQLRQSLLNELSLPTYLTTNAIVDVINNLVSYEEYKEILKKIKI